LLDPLPQASRAQLLPDPPRRSRRLRAERDRGRRPGGAIPPRPRAPPPPPTHPALAPLKPWQQKTIRKLAALLRIADALDRTHASRVEELYCSIRAKRVKLEVISRFAVDLELESVREHGRLFEKVFERKLAARQGLETAEA